MFHRYATLVLSVFTVISWISYVGFVQHPQNLAISPYFPTIFSFAFAAFAQFHTLLAFLVVASLLVSLEGWGWLKAFASVFGICLLAELGGTTVGFPFGHYAYGELLGPKLFGHVPILIPMSWFAVATCAQGMAVNLFPRSPLTRVGLTALGLVLWDLSLDPAMSYLFTYWTWGTHGAYYGMPLYNVLGWLGTGLVIGSSFEWLHFGPPLTRASVRHWGKLYALLVSLSFGFVALGGLWLAVATTLGAHALTWLALTARPTSEAVVQA